MRYVTEKEFCKTLAWKKMREKILRRDGYRCVDCRRYGRVTEATTVHHIQHYDEHPELALDPSNLISLCASCHNAKHPEKGRMARKSRRSPPI